MWTLESGHDPGVVFIDGRLVVIALLKTLVSQKPGLGACWPVLQDLLPVVHI